MIFENLSREGIRKLNQIALGLYDICVKLPSKEQVDEAQEEIAKLFPKEQFSHRDYAVRVLIALDYAKTHPASGARTLFDEIKDDCKQEVKQ